MNFLKNTFPLINDLSGYSRSFFTADLIAGLTVGVLLIPQGMAYAVLAGLPPIYGLYGGLIPLFLYAFFGTSRQLSIGPVAVSSIVLAEGISRLGVEPLSTEFIGYAIAAGLFIGLLQMIFGLLKMGFLVNFLSQPVIAGFTSAAAFIILASQLSDLLGFSIPREFNLFKKIAYAAQNIEQANWIAVTMCTGAMGIMLLLRKMSTVIPGALVVVVLGTLLCYFLDLPAYGLAIVGTIPEGLPVYQTPDISIETLEKIFPTVLTVTIIGIIESIGIAKSIEAKHQDYTIRPSQELFAIGISKIGGAFFQAMPTSGSFTRSAINNEAGARTTIASLVTFVVILLTLLFLTPIFYYLPKAILAAIILLAIRSLIEYEKAIYLWEKHRREFLLMIVTFITTLTFGIEEGVIAGVILSIANVLHRSSTPHIAILGIVPGKTYYRNIDRFETVKQENNALIVRFDNQLFFINASFFKDKVKDLVNEEKRPLKAFILDAKSMYHLDSTGISVLRDIHQFLKGHDIEFFVCGAIGPVRDILERENFIDELGENRWFLSLHDGIEYFKEE
ncbi:MAG: SulP family sulfate permease [Saprospiraceae bacterium]